MQRIILGVLCVLVIGCSSESSARKDSILARIEQEAQKSSPPAFKPAVADTLPVNNSTPAILISPSIPSGSVDTSKDTKDVAVKDSLEDESSVIAQKLEQARQHYLAALSAQEAKDSALSEQEFENSIQILNELSYFPEIESNKDFTDLSRSVIEDYEKYIATIDDVGPNASIFALREKLNQDIENSAETTISIPRNDITGFAVPLPYNEYVERAINFFMGKGREHFERWIYRSGKYFPIMRKIFKEEGVPEELLYLSMCESGLQPNANSWKKAVGLWQFIKGTGALYGLRVNWWYDERMDFEKSTRAAARHMKDLYTELGDWNLVLASYDAGAGRIYRGIRRSGSTDYWEMRRFLPRETRNYIPQYVAVTRMFLNPEQYGFKDIEVADTLTYEVSEVNDCVDLEVLAKCAETDVETLRELNPELLRGCTPPGVTGYRLRIPVGKKEIFAQNYTLIPPDQKKDWALHKVRKGETLASIAKKYGLSTSVLKEVNNLKPNKKLSVGSSLQIPLTPSDVAEIDKVPFNYDREPKKVSFGKGKDAVLAEAKANLAKPSRYAKHTLKAPKGKERLTYSVKRGDTIGHIAEWYGVRASDIRNWNNIAYGSYIRTRQDLTIWVDQAKASLLSKVDDMTFAQKEALKKGETPNGEVLASRVSSSRPQKERGWVNYTVKAGDALGKIANDYGVSVGDLKSWNGLRSNKIVVGQSLEIYNEPEERTKIVTSQPRESRSHATAENTTKNGGGVKQSHRVKKGETLSEIANVYGVSIKELMQYNKLRSSKISINKILKIPSASATTSENVLYYKVKNGDTLWKISKKYGVSVKALEQHNDVADGLHPGDRLAIPSK